MVTSTKWHIINKEGLLTEEPSDVLTDDDFVQGERIFFP